MHEFLRDNLTLKYRVQIVWEEKSVCLRKMWLLLELSLEARILCWEYSSISVKSGYMIKQKIFSHLIWAGSYYDKKYVCPYLLIILISWWNEMIVIVTEWGPRGLERIPYQFIHNIVSSELVGIWMKIHLNPKAENSKIVTILILFW